MLVYIQYFFYCIFVITIYSYTILYINFRELPSSLYRQ